MAEGLHPVFGESAENIPGLDICQPLEIQLISYSQKLEKGAYTKDMNIGKQRYMKEFQIPRENYLLKEIWPTRIRSGYDKIKNEAVSLLNYEELSFNDVFDLIRETEILRSSSNKHLLEFYGTVYESNVKIVLSFEPFVCFLSQLLSEEHQQLLDEPVIKCAMSQLYAGLAYLHENNIVHRDMSTKNIVFTEKGLLKICNFRNARRISQRYEKALFMEFRYQPVDVLLSSQTISTAIDIWSATCIFGELILKRTLFKSPLPDGVLKEIFALLGCPSKVWPEFTKLPGYSNLNLDESSQTWFNQINVYFKQDIVTEMLLRKGFTYDPNSRISAEECLQDPYFVNEPKACSSKSFGMKLHDRTFKFPVTHSPDAF